MSQSWYKKVIAAVILLFLCKLQAWFIEHEQTVWFFTTTFQLTSFKAKWDWDIEVKLDDCHMPNSPRHLVIRLNFLKVLKKVHFTFQKLINAFWYESHPFDLINYYCISVNAARISLEVEAKTRYVIAKTELTLESKLSVCIELVNLKLQGHTKRFFSSRDRENSVSC